MGVRKLVTRIMNIGFLAGSAIAIAGIVTQPLVKIQIDASIPGDLVSDLIKKQFTGDNPDKSTQIYRVNIKRGETNEISDMLPKIIGEVDFNSAFKNISIPVPIEMPSFIEFMKVDKNEQPKIVALTVTKSIEAVKETAVPELIKGVEQLVPEIAKSAAKYIVKDNVGKQIADILKVATDDNQVNQNLEKVNEQINELVSATWDTLASGTATVDQVMDSVTESINDVFEALSDVPEFVDANGQPYKFEKDDLSNISATLNQTFDDLKLLNDDGTIKDINGALSVLIDMIPGFGSTEQTSQDTQETPTEEEKHQDESPKEDKGEPVNKSLTKRDAATPSDQNDEIKAKLLEKIEPLLDKIPMDTINGINLDEMIGVANMTMYAYLGLCLLASLPWLLFLIFTLVRTLRKRKCWAKPWFIFVFAFLELILGAGLYFGLKYGLPFALDKFGGMLPIPAEYAGLLTGISISFKMHCLWAGIVYLAMIPYTIVYMVFAHGAKKEYKIWKKAKALAKKISKGNMQFKDVNEKYQKETAKILAEKYDINVEAAK